MSKPNVGLVTIRFLGCCILLVGCVLLPARAAEPVCAVVKIEIRQELTLERQAFDAHMRITNGLDTFALENVDISVWFQDENGQPVLASSDPDHPSALFFIRLDDMSGVNDISGAGTIAPASTADIHWLIIPAFGAGGNSADGNLYFVGATLSYTTGGEPETVEVEPDFITVRPMPRLSIDYFLPEEVVGNDPLTPEVEESEPFELGVRISNSGFGMARNLAIESAQPEIVDNAQGLLIHFEILDTQVNDQPAVNSLLASFGDLEAGGHAIAVWRMVSSLYGNFVSFEAAYHHADELGGELTSLIDRIDTHTLIRSVRNDLPGRDAIRDFLTRTDVGVRLYESQGIDTDVFEASAESSIEPTGGGNGVEFYSLDFPATAGPVHTVIQDPTGGNGVVSAVWRSDGKRISATNYWQASSKASGEWERLLHLFDTNSTGKYEIAFQVEQLPNQPPVLDPVANRVITAGDILDMVFSATDPDGDPLSFTLSPLPAASSFTDAGNGMAHFSWPTAESDIGLHDFVITVSDGEHEVSAPFQVSIVDEVLATILIEAELPLETTEDGGQDSFEIRLGSMPEADVWIPLESSNESQGVVTVAGLQFTPRDWDVPRTVWVQGVGNDVFDGDVEYEILIGPALSSDANYHGLIHEPLPAINRDNDEPKILVSPVSGLATAGPDTSAWIQIHLNGPPTDTVSIALESSHPEFGVPDPTSVVIDPDAWNDPFQVEIQGRAEVSLEPGETPYLISAVHVASTDENFDGLEMDLVEVLHRSGDTWGLEAGRVELPPVGEVGGWTAVDFAQPFRTIPVVVFLADDGEPDPASVRIRHVTKTGFEAVQVEPPAAHGPTAAINFHYLAVEPGVHPLPDGGIVEAGTLSTQKTQTGVGFPGPGNRPWETIGFEIEFMSRPILLAAVQSLENEAGVVPLEPSRPWLTVAVENVLHTGASIALDRSSVNEGGVESPEMIGFVAIAPGSATFATSIGWTDWHGQELSEPVGPWRFGCEAYEWFADADTDAVVLAHQATRLNQNSGGWLRLCRNEFGAPGLVVDQDVERTPVRGVREEFVRALRISRPFHTRLLAFPPDAGDDEGQADDE